jgi:hypothetical protein
VLETDVNKNNNIGEEERNERKNSLYYSSLELWLQYADIWYLYIGKHNEPIVWANDLCGHPLIIFIT